MSLNACVRVPPWPLRAVVAGEPRAARGCALRPDARASAAAARPRHQSRASGHAKRRRAARARAARARRGASTWFWSRGTMRGRVMSGTRGSAHKQSWLDQAWAVMGEGGSSF
eukprot:6176736-Pleurochrysis_carterae.AAC.1